MPILKKRLLIDADAYVKNGMLKRWKHSGEKDLINVNLQLNLYYQIPLTETDIKYIKTFDNVVIETGQEVEFVNFNSVATQF